MRFPIALSLCCLLLACDNSTETSLSSFPPDRQLVPWTENPRYWSWNGTDPQLLLGIERGLPLPPEDGLRKQLTALARAGGNLYRLRIEVDREYATPATERLIEMTRDRGLVLEFAPTEESLRAELQDWRSTLNQPTNHILPISEEQTFYAQDPSRWVPSFNRSALAGLPAVTLPSFTQAGLNAIRGLRAVERRVPFWNLRPAPHVIRGTDPGMAVAAADPASNYVIYLPTTETVTINLPEAEQVRRRVSVIGHLGTSRSEVLEPPYDATFTLTSNEPNGGWLLIEKLAPGSF